MRKTIRVALALVTLGLLGMQLIRPPRTNPASDPASALATHVVVPSTVAEILDRSCRDCHSSGTRWPWYSGVAPVSWFVIDHVDHGRTHFNYSDWGRYSEARRRELLENTCALVRSGSMPPGSYLLMHSGARVSAADADVLCRWTVDAQVPTADLIR